MTDWKNDIKRYRNHEMTPEEEHAFEKRALNDPFLSEALEGSSMISSKEFSEDIADIQQEIHQKTRSKSGLWLLRIAASLALVILVYFAITPFLKNNVQHNLALQESEIIEQSTEAPGTRNDSTITSAESKKEDRSALNTSATKEKSSKTKVSDEKINQDVTSQQSILAISPDAKLQEEEKILDKELSVAFDAEETKVAAQEEIVRLKVQTEDLNQPEKSTRRNFTVTASPHMVQGKVLSAEDDTPIPGVNIIIKGTHNGTITDINGHYKLMMDSTHSDLIFSFIGLQTQEVNVSNQSELTVKLQPDVAQLSEVVVTGYSSYIPIDGREPIIKLAEPSGGRRAYDKYLHNSIQYPQQALDNKIKGRVTVTFTVRTDGSLDEFNVLKGLGYGCDEEVIRLVKEGPKWSPTTEDSVPIESEVRVRVKFALPD